MPTQNIFILYNRNGRKSLSNIDFWNLAGRAGRLTKELSGNIFCVQHQDCDWKNTNDINNKEIQIKPSVFTRVDKNLIKIEKLLNEQDISGSQEEEYILQYIANIISVDTMDLGTIYQSPVIERLITKNKNKIIDLAKSKVEGFEIPKHILKSNQSIKLSTQNNIYKKLLALHANGQDIKLPLSKDITYDVCFNVLENMHQLYEWEEAEGPLRNPKRLKYFALLMNQWISGVSLRQIIDRSIYYYSENRKEIWITEKRNYLAQATSCTSIL